jgi:hypothetical protein
MGKKDIDKQYKEIEDLLQTESLDYSQVLFREILDCYFNSGGPFFEDKVESLQYLAEGHHRILEDKKYFAELEEAVIEEDNEEEEITKMRDPSFKGEVSKETKPDYKKIYRAILSALGRNGLLYKKERFMRF